MLVAAIAVSLSFGVIPGVAQAQLSWTSPVAIAHGANSTDGLNAISCPSASQCTAAGEVGQVVTFNPASPGTPTPAPVDGGRNLVGISCPAATQCTGVDTAGDVVTFNPTSPGTPTPAAVDTGGFPSAIACPTVSQCTVADENGDAVTFSPASPTATANSQVVSADSLLLGIACPTAAQCTAIDAGDAITFEPGTTSTPTTIPIDANDGLRGVACPTTGQCTAVDQNGTEFTLHDPSNPDGKPSSANIDGEFDDSLAAITCSSTTQCVAVGSAAEITFTPGSDPSPTRVVIDSGQDLSAVSCAATGGECAAVDGDGQVVGFVATSGAATAATPAGGDPITSLSCPSDSQCTASDENGNEITFGLPISGTPTPESVEGYTLASVSCPAMTQCTGVTNGDAVTFDPQAAGAPTALAVVREPGTLIACPSASQCTSVAVGTGNVATASTFDPLPPTSTTTTTKIEMQASDTDPGTIVEALACPSATQCIAVDSKGEEAPFDPATGGTR